MAPADGPLTVGAPHSFAVAPAWRIPALVLSRGDSGRRKADQSSALQLQAVQE